MKFKSFPFKDPLNRGSSIYSKEYIKISWRRANIYAYQVWFSNKPIGLSTSTPYL